MTRTKLLIILAAVAVLLGASGSALAVSGAGGIALQFPIGARYNALGEAGTALAQDVTAMWWNPGGFAFANGNRYGGAETEDPDASTRSIHMMHSPLVPDLADDIALTWVGYGSRKWGGNFGAHLTFLTMGQQEATDDNGNVLGFFNSNMWAFGLAYGALITPNAGVGISAKYFRDNLAPDDLTQEGTGGSGSTFAVDAGLLVRFSRANLGVAVRNLGPDITHVDEDQSDPVFRNLTVGTAFSVMSSELQSVLVVSDFLVPLLPWDEGKQDYGFGFDFQDKEVGVGAEWQYDNSMFLRVGHKWGTGDIEGLTYGFGLYLGKWVGQNITFSYASVPQAKGLSDVQRFSFGYDF